MKRYFTKPKLSILLQFLVPYIIVLLIPLFIGLITYEKTVEVIEADIEHNNINLLDQSKEMLDRRLAEVEMVVSQIARDTKVLQFQNVSEPFEGANTSRIMETKAGLYDYSLSNNFIFSSYLLFKKSSLVLTADSAYAFPYFFQQVVSYDRLTEKEWTARYLDKYHHKKVIPAQPVTYNGKKQSMLTYIESMGYRNNLTGSIAVLIENKEIQKLMSGLDISEGGWAYIADENGEILSYITTVPGEPEPPLIDLAKRKGFFVHSKLNMMITYTTSTANNWTYIVAQPTHIVFEKVNYIKKITFSIVLVSLLVGLAIAYILAFKSSRTVRSLVQLLSKHGEGEQKASGVYGVIHGAVSRLVNSVEELRAKFEVQAPLLHAAFMERLLKGEFHTMKDARTVMEHLGLNIDGSRYAVVLLKIRGNAEQEFTHDTLSRLNINRFVIKEALRQERQPGVYVHDIEEDKIAVVFTFGSSDEDECKAALRLSIGKVTETLQQDLQVDALFAVGGVYGSLLEISRSYEEAKQAMHRHTDWNSHVAVTKAVWFTELPPETHSYYYPYDIELRLTNFTKVGDHTEANKLLEELFKQNFSDRSLSVYQTKLLLFEMTGTLVKLSDQMAVEDMSVHERIKAMLQYAEQLNDLDRFKTAVKTAYGSLCDQVNNRKNHQNQQLVEEIRSFIHNGYANADFSLAAAAQQFQVSEAYLSQFFKEKSGVNFFDYLEGIRMEHARTMLRESQLPVNEIAAKVGYSSLNTFSRAFKRFHRFSATEYRLDSRKTGGKPTA